LVYPPSHLPLITTLSLDADSDNVGQIGKILGERWKNMNEKDKAQYEAKATKDKERYEAEKRAYNVLSPPIGPILITCRRKLSYAPPRKIFDSKTSL
jgi:2-keto-4-pentenoate hydratase